MSFNQQLFDDTIFPIAGGLSILGSFSVVLTGILFADLRRKKFMQIIFLISFCDLLGNISASWGFPKNSSILCPIQGATRIFFYRASWLWTTVLAYQLRCTVILGKITLKKRIAHLIVWTISLILLLLPYSTNEYGQDDQISGRGWCSIRGNSLTAGIWLLLISQVPVMFCMCLSSYFAFEIDSYSKSFELSSFPQVQAAVTSLLPYPLAMIVTWFPATIIGPLLNFGAFSINNTTSNIAASSEALGGLYGLCLAVIFFSKSKEAKLLWIAKISSVLEDCKCSFGSKRLLSHDSKNGSGNPHLRTGADYLHEFFDNEDEDYDYYSKSNSTIMSVVEIPNPNDSFRSTSEFTINAMLARDSIQDKL